MGINNVGIDIGKVAPVSPIERPSFGRCCNGGKKCMRLFLGALRAGHGGGGGYYVRIAVGIWATMAAAKNAQRYAAAKNAQRTIAYAIEIAEIKKRGAAQPLRFPSAGRSLNSWGFLDPRTPPRKGRPV